MNTSSVIITTSLDLETTQI